MNNTLMIFLLLFLLGFFILIAIALFKKKKVKGYLKIWGIFEGGIESED